MNKIMELDKSEKAALKRLIKEEVRQAETTNPTEYGLDGKKPKNKYGLKTLTTLYSLQSKFK